MPVDKFGHYHKIRYNTFKEDVEKTLGFVLDEHENLDIQNKRIRNISPPMQSSDAVNKAYLHQQINHNQEILKRGISKEIAAIKKTIDNLQKMVNETYSVMASLAKTSNNGKESVNK